MNTGWMTWDNDRMHYLHTTTLQWVQSAAIETLYFSFIQYIYRKIYRYECKDCAVPASRPLAVECVKVMRGLVFRKAARAALMG